MNRNSEIINKDQNFQPFKNITEMIIKKLGKIERKKFTIIIYTILLILSLIIFFFSASYVIETILLPALNKNTSNASISEIITAITPHENKVLLIMSFGFISTILHAYILTKINSTTNIKPDKNHEPIINK